MVRIKLKYLLVLLVILYVCSLASALEEKTRQKQPKPRGINSRHQPSRRSLTIKERPNINKFTSGDLTDRKVSNRLIGGGHLKLESSNLDRDDDVAQWDDGLFLSSAGNGKEKKLKKPEDDDDDDDDDKKTLAQQVKEGKYGLIQTEIYGKKPKRPGIISYQSNPEVPKDNSKNLGGLDEEEIWLAENHVLVLRGGNFPAQNTEQQPTGDLQGWSPIDNYEAPKRQVKIPEKPKIPPPFPIQLIENGPVKILENNDTAINDNKPTWLDALIVASNDTLYKKIVGNNTKSSDNNNNNDDDSKNINSGQVLGGVVGPFYPSLPPGAVFVPPPNQTDYDEDDQSIYYPPAYSFKYYQENSTAVPPGPLVPGIILPPPPNFFSQLQENKTTTLPPPSPSTTIKLPSTKYQKRPTTPKSLETYYPSRKSNTKPYKTFYSSTVSTTKELSRPFTMKPINKYKQQKNVTISFTETITKPPERIPIIVVTTTTTPLPKQDSTLEKTLSSTKKSINWNTDDVASKSAPIVAYYPSTTTPQPTIDDAIEATPVSIKNIITDKLPPNVPSSASYYFYEESNDSSPGTTSNSIYFEETTESPYYQVKDAQESQSKKPYYNVQVTPSQQTAEDYSVEVIEPILKTPGRYHQYSQQTLRSQGQRLLSDPLPLFYQTVTERPNQLGLQNFFTTPLTKEKIKFDQNTKSKPVYQYSFEAADYSKHGRQSSPLYKQNVPNQQLKKHVAFNEWQEVQDDAQQQQQQYNDYEAEVISEPRVQTEQNHYRQRLPVVFPTTTSRPINHIVDTTPNPQHSYYTKQDDTYLDDVTREYFTNFGKKIKPERLSSTTPIYGKTSSVTERPERPQTYPTVNSFINNNNNNNDYENQKVYKTPRVNVHYGDQPQGHYSLEDDTRVNYQRPLPQINPDAEYLPGFSQKPNNHQILERYQQQQNIHKNTYLSNLPTRKLLLPPVDNYNNKQILRQGLMPLDDSREPIKQQIFRQRPISLSGDISVNYRNPRPQINPDSEYIDPTNRHAIINNDKPSSYFAYRLPGDGGHFYFLTPHAITQRQDGNSGFIYPQKREPRRAAAAAVGNNPS